MTDVDAAVKRLHENLASFDAEAAFELESEGERADLWTEIDVNVDDVRAILDALAASEAARIKAEGEVERLRAALIDAENDRDRFIEGKVLAEKQRDDASDKAERFREERDAWFVQAKNAESHLRREP